MRVTLAALSIGLCIACGAPAEPPQSSEPHTPTAAAPQSTTPPVRTQSPAPPGTQASPTFPLRVARTGFSDASGTPFAWRGVSAFRLAEMLSTGREPDVVRYLDWAASRRLTVVRVLLMARHLFQLTPEAGREALPRLLDLAKARGLAVEIVALADTAGVAFDYDAHLKAVGQIAFEAENGLVEIANEPGHATQDRRLHDPSFVKRLAAVVPEPVTTALGSAEYDEAYAGGDYATYHFPRGRDWDHVLSLGDAIAMLARLKKPLINDEPIGAAAEYQAGRRDNSPERFGAAGALAEFIGLGSTFHYEGGLQARLPDERETACLDAWQRGIELVSAHGSAELLTGDSVTRQVASVPGGRQVFGRVGADRGEVLVIDPPGGTAKMSIRWTEGWVEDRRASAPGALLVSATRRP